MEPDLRKRYQSAGELLKALNACKKHLNQQRPLAERCKENAEKKESFFGVGHDLTEEEYQRRRKRAKRVSYFTGIFSVGVFAVLLFVFLWNFWLEDLFRTAERVDVPGFTGKSYEAVVNDKQYSDYRFTVVYTVDPEVPDGVIIAQDPEAGKSRMRVPEGISVQLTVSTGVVMAEVPYVVNEDYEAATEMLEKAGFTVTTEFQASKDVTAKYVIRSEPAPGEKTAVGTSVKLIVSGGPTLRDVTVPDLSTLTESAAIAHIESSGLCYGGTYKEANDAKQGTVFKQSAPANTKLTEYSKVYIWGLRRAGKTVTDKGAHCLWCRVSSSRRSAAFTMWPPAIRSWSARARGRFRYDGCSLLVGDRVQLSFDAHGKGRIDAVEQRRNAFIRPAVANIDQLIMIGANVNPITDPFLIDRVVAIAENAGCEPVVCPQISATLTRRSTSMTFTAPSVFAFCARALRPASAWMRCVMRCAGRPVPSPATPASANRACSMRSTHPSALRPAPLASGLAAASIRRAMSSSMLSARTRLSPTRRASRPLRWIWSTPSRARICSMHSGNSVHISASAAFVTVRT